MLSVCDSGVRVRGRITTKTSVKLGKSRGFRGRRLRREGFLTRSSRSPRRGAMALRSLWLCVDFGCGCGTGGREKGGNAEAARTQSPSLLLRGEVGSRAEKGERKELPTDSPAGSNDFPEGATVDFVLRRDSAFQNWGRGAAKTSRGVRGESGGSGAASSPEESHTDSTDTLGVAVARGGSGAA